MEELWPLLRTYIEAKIREEIADAFGRDSLYETIRSRDAEKAVEQFLREGRF